MGRRILVEYDIISGRTVERRRTHMTMRYSWEPAARRGKRCAESTQISLKIIRLKDLL